MLWICRSGREAAILGLDAIKRSGQKRFESRVCQGFRHPEGPDLQSKIIKLCKIFHNPPNVGLKTGRCLRIVLHKLRYQTGVEVRGNPRVWLRQSERIDCTFSRPPDRGTVLQELRPRIAPAGRRLSPHNLLLHHHAPRSQAMALVERLAEPFSHSRAVTRLATGSAADVYTRFSQAEFVAWAESNKELHSCSPIRCPDLGRMLSAAESPSHSRASLVREGP